MVTNHHGDAAVLQTGELPVPPIADDEVLVQVIKEGIGSKGPTLSTYISIPGRYLVLMPALGRVGVSRKIEDHDARRRLREIMNTLAPPKGVGFIVRTAAVDRDAKETSTGKTMVAVLLRSDGGFVRGVWFNQPYMFRRFELGQRVLFSGKPKFTQRRWEFSHPHLQFLGEDEGETTGGLLPRYGLTEGLKQHEMCSL